MKKQFYQAPLIEVIRTSFSANILQDSGDAGMFPVNPIEREDF